MLIKLHDCRINDYLFFIHKCTQIKGLRVLWTKLLVLIPFTYGLYGQFPMDIYLHGCGFN